MDITIYWKPKHDRPGRYEKHRISEGEYDVDSDFLVEFRSGDGGNGWFLGVSEFSRDDAWYRDSKGSGGTGDYVNDSVSAPKRKLLCCESATQAQYFEWLSDNIAIILIDGREFWISPEAE